jgi:hypothetical protein
MKNIPSKSKLALVLQDAYWYADQAAEDVPGRGMAPTRSEAVRRAFQKAREGGLKLSTVDFPRVIASAKALLVAVECYGWSQGVDARTGEVIAEAVVGARVEDSSWGRVGTVTHVEGNVVTLDVGGKSYQVKATDLRVVKGETEEEAQSRISADVVAEILLLEEYAQAHGLAWTLSRIPVAGEPVAFRLTHDKGVALAVQQVVGETAEQVRACIRLAAKVGR